MRSIVGTLQSLGQQMRRKSPLCVTVGIICTLLGVIVLVGWQLHVQELMRIIPDTPRMFPLTAALFILTGVAFILLHQRQTRAVTILGLVLSLAGLAVLLRLLFHLPFALDHLIFPVQTSHGGLSINVALTFVLLGGLFIAVRNPQKPHRGTVRALSITIIMITLLTVVSYLFGVHRTSPMPSFVPMAVPTAAGFFLVGMTFLGHFGRVFDFEINNRVVWLFFVVSGLILATTALAYENTQRLARTQTELQKRIDYQIALDGILTDTLNVETGQRGYLLTGNEVYLKPYAAAYKSVGGHLKRLQELSAGHPDQLRHLNELIQALIVKDKELSETIALKKSGQTDAALEIVRSNQGLQSEERIRHVIHTMQQSETNAYGNTLASARQSVQRTTWIIIGSCIINIGLMALVLNLIVREAAERVRRQRQLEDTLFAVEAQRVQNQALLASIGDGVFAIDRNSKIILFNQVAADITGYSEAEAIGSNYRKILKFPDEHSGKTSHAFIRRALEGKRNKKPGRTVVAHKDGHLIPVADSAAPIVSPDGSIVGAIVVFRDVTEEHAVERAKDEFVALASHQLRTPATGVKQYLSMLVDGYGGDISNAQLEMVKKAFESNERQLGIIEDMLSVAQIDAGRMVLHPQPTNLNDMLDDIVREQRTAFNQRGQKISVLKPKTPLTANVDPRWLRMAVENIINNAGKYTPEGGSITIKLTGSSKHPVITVQDTGIGIPEEAHSTLFDKFTRVEDNQSAKVGGSGLGLYLAHSIVTSHGGRITVESQPGAGATFIITL